MEEWRGGDLPAVGSKWNLGHGVLMMTAKGTSHEWNWCCAKCYGRMDPYVYEMFRFSGDPAFRDRAVQIERAHDFMVYPSVDEGGYRAMLNEGVICARNVYHPGHTYYGYAGVASSSADPTLLGGGVRQGLADGQFLGSWQPSEAGVFFPDDYARLRGALAASNVNRPLPTTPGRLGPPPRRRALDHPAGRARLGQAGADAHAGAPQTTGVIHAPARPGFPP